MRACFPAPDALVSCCPQLKEIRDYQRNALTPGQPPKIEEPEESEEEEEEEEEDDDEAQVSAEEEEVCLMVLPPAAPVNDLGRGLAGQPLGWATPALAPAHAPKACVIVQEDAGPDVDDQSMSEDGMDPQT